MSIKKINLSSVKKTRQFASCHNLVKDNRSMRIRLFDHPDTRLDERIAADLSKTTRNTPNRCLLFVWYVVGSEPRQTKALSVTQISSSLVHYFRNQNRISFLWLNRKHNFLFASPAVSPQNAFTTCY